MEVESPSSHSPLVEVEVIEKNHLPHFNLPLLDTLDYVLQEVNIIDYDLVSPYYMIMSMVSQTQSVSSPTSTIPSVQGGISVCLLISSSSGEAVPFVVSCPTLYSLWSMPSIPPFPSLANFIVGQLVITSQPSMSNIQSNIVPNLTVNLGSSFPPCSGTLIAFTIMSSTGYPFAWN